jgi:hypothetical protein
MLSSMPQAGSFTATPQAPQASFSYQAAGQDSFNMLPTSGSFVAGGYDASGGQVGGPMGQFSNPFLAAMYSTLNGQTDPRHWPQFDVPNMPYAAATRTEARVEPVVRREYEYANARPQTEQREERAQDLGGGESLQAEDPTKKILDAKEKEDKKKRKKEKEEKSGFWFWTCS